MMRDITKEMPAYVYMVHCADGSLYTGWTTDVAKRVEAHNGKAPGGAKYTRARRPVQLVWQAWCANAVIAQKLEYRLKRMARRDKLILMTGDESTWQKLCRDIESSLQKSSQFSTSTDENSEDFCAIKRLSVL